MKRNKKQTHNSPNIDFSPGSLTFTHGSGQQPDDHFAAELARWERDALQP